MKRVLKFDENGLKGLHFFTECLDFPVVVASYGDREEQVISYLESNFRSGVFDTETICRWCVNHQVQYQIICPFSIRHIFGNPYKYIKFLRLKHMLNKAAMY